MRNIINKLFGRSSKIDEELAKAKQKAAEEHARTNADPLDIVARQKGWKESPPDPITRTISDFPIAIRNGLKFVMDDKKVISGHAMDASDESCATLSGPSNNYTVPEQLQQWFMAQSFIGYQACAIIAQHWLVDKACSMAGEDAIRNGWEISAVGDDADLSKDDHDRLRAYDIPFKLKENLAELNRFKNVFGIRVACFVVESDDDDYYEKPFNIDGVTEGSYKGISQIDPYWMMPMMTAESTSDPSSMHFYDPEFWVISGKKYHRSHLIIARGPQPADILKPTYIFGGIPLTQRIYERVYAAERTANEAPLLSLSKRTTALHVDVEKAITNQSKFEERLMFWIKYRDNHAVKVLGKEEAMEQFDTNLSDFDSVIMNQYQLVSAIAKVPSTKMLGTSPKGFSATGEFEEKSYHEELESIQEHTMSPMVSRHYLLLGKSLGIKCQVEVVFNDVDSVSAEKQAALNDKKADTDKKNIEMGAVSPDEVRDRLRDDKNSGYNRLSNEDAEAEPGMSPDNLAKLEKAGQEASMAGAGLPFGAPPSAVVPPTGEAEQADGGIEAFPNVPNPVLKLSEPGIVESSNSQLIEVIAELRDRLIAVEGAVTPNNTEIKVNGSPGVERTAKPSVTGINPTVAAFGAVLPPVDPSKHPKMKVNGILISVENPRGTIRQGMDLSGAQWSQKMPHHYGFIRGVVGADGDELDCFVGENLGSVNVFVVNQKEPTTGEFDEHKVMLGFDSYDDAKSAYHAAYSSDWQGFDSMAQLSMDDFKHWLKSVDGCTTPLAAACIEQTANAPSMTANDKADFKESDHPRAKNGQFGSGGSSSATASKTSVKLGSKKDALPKIAKEITEKNNGKPPTPEQFHKAVTEMGFVIIPEQSVKYLKMFLKEHKAVKSDDPKPAEKAAEKTPESTKESSEKKAKAAGYATTSGFVSEAAFKAGYKSEGTFNKIDYFKAGNGDKVSYKSESDSWMAMSGGQIKAQGSGLESLEQHLKENKAKAADPAKKNTMANAPVSVSHTTETAKKYGDVIPESDFSFAKSGIANEKALPQKVKESIVAYKGSSYHVINSAMRFNESFDPSSVSSQTMAHILNLQRAFSAVAPSQKEVTVGRKITSEGLKAMAKDAGLNSLNDLKPGMVLREPGIVSTSHNPDVWTGDVRFEIKLPKGSKAIDISETIKLHKSEEEVLLGPDSKLKIHEVKQNHKTGSSTYKYHIVCELVQ